MTDNVLSIAREMKPGDLLKFLEDNRKNGFLDLPQQHRAFALEYVQSYDLFASADLVGIPRTAARRTLNNPLVRCFIEYLNAEAQYYSLLNKTFIEAQYLSLYAKLIGAEEVEVFDVETGKTISVRNFRAAPAVACLRDMAKMAGMFPKEGLISVNVGVGIMGSPLTERQQKLLDSILDDEY